jgi:threonine dehydrogenase-like Zn-dependent dehydrogenase
MPASIGVVGRERTITHMSVPSAVPVGSRSARALWFTGPRSAELRAEQVGPPGEGEVLVRSVVSLISPGTEMLVYRGEATPEMFDTAAAGSGGGPAGYPLKYAYQVVGRVEEVGPGARHAEGDLVFARHPHQDRFVVRDDPATVPTVPEDLPPERAVFANLVDVAVSAVHDVPIRIGDAVVVYGGGIIGSLCAQLARATAGTVVVVDASGARRELAREWGADVAVDPAAAPLAIHQLTAGRGADVAIATSGTSADLQPAIEATGVEGTVVAVTLSGTHNVPLRLSPEFHLRRQRMVSTQVSGVGRALQPRWSFARRMEVVLELLRSERVRVQASHSFPFDRAPEAYHLMDARPDETMGVTLEY